MHKRRWGLGAAGAQGQQHQQQRDQRKQEQRSRLTAELHGVARQPPGSAASLRIAAPRAAAGRARQLAADASSARPSESGAWAAGGPATAEEEEGAGEEEGEEGEEEARAGLEEWPARAYRTVWSSRPHAHPTASRRSSFR